MNLLRATVILSAILCATAPVRAEMPDTGGLNLGAAPSRAEAPEVLSRYFTATQEQQARLRDTSMEMDIEAKLPRLKKEGSLHGLRQIAKSGEISNEGTRTAGDKMVIKEVIARYLSAEAEASKGMVQGSAVSIGINPENYKFRHKATLSTETRRVYIYQVSPRRNRLGLFKGEIWVEAETGMPIREAGRLVKNPSVFLKRVDFVREYDLRDGLSYPVRVESTIDTRLVGRAELEIRYTNHSVAQIARAGIGALGW